MFGLNNNLFSSFDPSTFRYGRSLSSATTTSPVTRSQTHLNSDETARAPFTSIPSVNKPQTKKRGRKPDFEIFVDPREPNDLPPQKKTRIDGRKPLSVKTDSANSTPTPSPRLPTVPFPISANDPFWEDQENYDTHILPTPPPTPHPNRNLDRGLRIPNAPAAPPQEFRPRRSTRVPRRRRAAALPPLGQPVNMVLYELLGIPDWNASVEDIVAAYRAVVMKVHPDKVSEEEREEATENMQMVNGAKEVLINAESRRQYHLDGVLPWAA